jgi:aminoglycoside phosphotransferase (APT) family kinase protein
VQLHQLDWRPFVNAAAHHDMQAPYGFVERSLRSLRDTLAQFSLGGFRPIVDWLEARRQAVPCLSPALVHGDFHPYNILLRPDGSAVVIDWTGFRVADARFDLAWTLLLVRTHGNEVWAQCILREYERLAGATVQQLDWFTIFACVRRLCTVTVSLAQGAERAGMQHDAVSMMQQQREALQQVYALLQETTGHSVPEVERVFAAL